MTSRTTSLMLTGWCARRVFPQQRAQVVDDRAGPLVVLDDVVDGGPQLFEIQGVPGQKVPRGLRVAEHRRQRLTQFVRERTRELAEQRDPAQVRQSRGAARWLPAPRACDR